MELGRLADHRRAEVLLAHPFVVLCLIGWLANDHMLKQRYHNVATGKLSDAFAMVVFPILVALIFQRWFHRPLGWAIATTVVFYSSINLFDAVDRAVEVILSLLVHLSLIHI